MKMGRRQADHPGGACCSPAASRSLLGHPACGGSSSGDTESPRAPSPGAAQAFQRHRDRARVHHRGSDAAVHDDLPAGPLRADYQEGVPDDGAGRDHRDAGGQPVRTAAGEARFFDDGGKRGRAGGGPEEIRGAQGGGLRRARERRGGGVAVSAVFDGARDDLEAAGFVFDDLVSRAARGDRSERDRAGRRSEHHPAGHVARRLDHAG